MDQDLSVNLNPSASIRSDHSAIRRSFRVAVEPKDAIFVVLNAETYRVADMSPEGINIFCRDKEAFTLSQFIENCELIIPGETIKGLLAKVIHGSFGADGQWVNGIQWLNLTGTDLDRVVDLVSKIKNKLLNVDQDRS